MTRTSKVGYLRDIRRLTVALSRARLGLYILGRRDIFEACYELREAFSLLFQRPDKLMLATGEMWPSERILADEIDSEVPGEAAMDGVEHLGQFVFEMTNTKISQLRAERGLPEEAPIVQQIEPAEGDDVEDGLEAIDEEIESDHEELVRGFEAEEDE